MEVVNNAVKNGRTQGSIPLESYQPTLISSADLTKIGNLTLSRRLNESIVIGDNIMLTVREVKGKQVTLTVTAPQAISINRLEVYKSIIREN